MIQKEAKVNVKEKGKADGYNGIYFWVTVVYLYLLLYFFEPDKKGAYYFPL